MNESNANENCTDKINILRFTHGALKDFEDIVLIEKPCNFFLNGDLLEKITCTNKDIKELAAGYLLCEGYIRSKEELLTVKVDNESGSVYLYTSKCVDVHHDAGGRGIEMDYSATLLAVKKFQEMSPMFKETGAVHSAALLGRGNNFRYFCEDISRYNAVEKVIGKAFLDGFYLPHALLMTSSRMPLELIQKISGAGICAVVSISAPTLQSIIFARDHKMFLAGMFRDNRINIYSQGND